jgi:valyl-tRNA synthetase
MVFGTPKGADVIFSESILETGRNFAIKSGMPIVL